MARRAYFCAAYSNSLGQTEGHNYIFEVYVSGPVQEHSGMIIGVRELDELMQTIVSQYDHRYLNDDVIAFKGLAISASIICQKMHQDFTNILLPFNTLKLIKVRLYEGDDLWVDCGNNIEPEF